MQYLSIDEARAASGLRIVLTVGVPGPWGEALKAVLAHHHIDYQAAGQEPSSANAELAAWTGQTSAPVLALDDNPPVFHWLDILLTLDAAYAGAEVLPADPDQRSQVIGICAAIAGRGGFGWQRRLQLLSMGMQMPEPPRLILRMGRQYGYSEPALAAALPAMRDTTRWLEAVLARNSTSPYLVGDRPTAADFYWAHFSGMLVPLPPELNPMDDMMRGLYGSGDADTIACLTPALRAHRDHMFEHHIDTPLRF